MFSSSGTDSSCVEQSVHTDAGDTADNTCQPPNSNTTNTANVESQSTVKVGFVSTFVLHPVTRGDKLGGGGTEFCQMIRVRV